MIVETALAGLTAILVGLTIIQAVIVGMDLQWRWKHKLKDKP